MIKRVIIIDKGMFNPNHTTQGCLSAVTDCVRLDLIARPVAGQFAHGQFTHGQFSKWIIRPWSIFQMDNSPTDNFPNGQFTHRQFSKWTIHPQIIFQMDNSPTDNFPNGQFAHRQFTHGQFVHKYCYFVKKNYEFTD